MPDKVVTAVADLSADTVFLHGQVVTVDHDFTIAQALACKGDRLVAIGSDTQVQKLIGPHTQVIDLAGRTVLPGIVDAHNHMMDMGLKLSQIALDEVTSIAQMVELARERARETPPGGWIVGQGWNESFLAEGRMPNRYDLDMVSTEHYVLLSRFYDIDAVNSLVLELAGIDRNTPDPQGGRIERDEKGEPTGLLRASAKVLVRQLMPQPSTEEMVVALRAAGLDYRRMGITSIVDPGLRPREVHAYQTLYSRGELPLRVNLMPSWHGFHDDEDPQELERRAREVGLYTGFGDEWLRLGALKMVIDGGTTSHTAYMYQPFLGESVVVNYNSLDEARLPEYIQQAQELGWDVGIHCCGDRAQDLAVEAFDKVLSQVSDSRTRHNIIHGYFPTDFSLERMKEHNIAVVIQPTFIYYEGDDLFRDVGEERAANYKPLRKYLAHDIVVVASSDVTSTVSYNPFIGLYALVSRRSHLGTPIAPHQAASREEALRAYTVAGAYLTHEEDLKGSLEVGKLADFIVIDRDYRSVPVEEMKEIQVEMTVLGGQVVYESNNG